MKVTRNYLLVSACKNEEDNLPDLIKSITLQTIRPVVWVIVDDGSTDNTPQIIKDAAKNNIWIKYIQMPLSKRDLGIHYATIIEKGFNFAIEHCCSKNIDYSYLGNIDCDLTIKNNFFAYLIEKFEENSKLGIASGGTLYILGDKTIRGKLRYDEPSGGHMLIRKECYDSIGGIPLSYSADSVLKTKARIRGWETRRFEENAAVEARYVSSAEGYWKGHFQNGKSHYYLNFNPIHVLAKGICYSLKKPYYIGIAYMTGYFNDLIMKKKQIDDDDLKKYYWNKWKIGLFYHFNTLKRKP